MPCAEIVRSSHRRALEQWTSQSTQRTHLMQRTQRTPHMHRMQRSRSSAGIACAHDAQWFEPVLGITPQHREGFLLQLVIVLAGAHDRENGWDAARCEDLSLPIAGRRKVPQHVDAALLDACLVTMVVERRQQHGDERAVGGIEPLAVSSRSRPRSSARAQVGSQGSGSIPVGILTGPRSESATSDLRCRRGSTERPSRRAARRRW